MEKRGVSENCWTIKELIHNYYSCVSQRSRGQRSPTVGNKYLPFFAARIPLLFFVDPLGKTSMEEYFSRAERYARNAEYFPAFAPRGARRVSQEEGRKLLARSGVDWMLITLSLHPRSAGLASSPGRHSAHPNDPCLFPLSLLTVVGGNNSSLGSVCRALIIMIVLPHNKVI